MMRENLEERVLGDGVESFVKVQLDDHGSGFPYVTTTSKVCRIDKVFSNVPTLKNPVWFP